MSRRFGIAAVAALALAGCASSGDPAKLTADAKGADSGRSSSDRMDEARRGVADAALSPLKDVGLVRPEIPSILRNLEYPYETATLAGACAQVAYELGALDAHLGLETYIPGDERPLSERALDRAQGAAVGMVQDAATDMVPFRGWIRRISGADKAAKEAAHAFETGHTRRAFLRGYGSALGCPGMLPARSGVQAKR